MAYDGNRNHRATFKMKVTAATWNAQWLLSLIAWNDDPSYTDDRRGAYIESHRATKGGKQQGGVFLFYLYIDLAGGTLSICLTSDQAVEQECLWEGVAREGV